MKLITIKAKMVTKRGGVGAILQAESKRQTLYSGIGKELSENKYDCNLVQSISWGREMWS